MSGMFLSQYIHTRGFTAMMIVIAVCCSMLAFSTDGVIPLQGDKGLVLPSPNHWMAPGTGSLAVSLAVNIAVAMLTVYLNRAFNVMRSMTMLFAGLFFVMQAATPSLVTRFYGGIMVALVMVVCAILLFSIYGEPGRTRRVFLIFFIASASALCQYVMLFYIPLLLIGCVQMRVLNLRSFLAAVVGVVTPPWIGFGLGLLSVENLRWPDFVSYFSTMGDTEIMPIVATVGFTSFMGLVFTMFNLVRVFSYNSRTRAYNGFLSLTLFTTVVLTVFDFADMVAYVPLLNCSAAFQMGHFFSLRRSKRSYLGVVALIAAYGALYVWNLWN